MSARRLFCVMCGIGLNSRGSNGLDECSRSELGLPHLWAVEGHVLQWFKFMGVGRVQEPNE